MLLKISFVIFGLFFFKSAEAITSYCVYDVNKKTVIDSRLGNRRIYPASLTKLMTLYILFENIQNGTLNLNDEISDFDKKYKSRGRSIESYYDTNKKSIITIKDIVFALAVQSSNDASWIIAEEIRGKAESFIELMNEKANDFGLSGTNFTNPDGIFDAENYSTACDLSILMYKLWNDFPEYRYFLKMYYYFKDGRFYYKNTMIDRDMLGVDGSKTGYTSNSGYNIAFMFNRKNTKVSVAIIGGDSVEERSKAVSDILKKNIPSEDLLLIKKNEVEKERTELTTLLKKYLIND